MKAIARYRKKDGSWEPQKNVPLNDADIKFQREEAIRAEEKIKAGNERDFVERKEALKAMAAAKSHHESLMSDNDAPIKAKYRTKSAEIDSKKTIEELEAVTI